MKRAIFTQALIGTTLMLTLCGCSSLARITGDAAPVAPALPSMQMPVAQSGAIYAEGGSIALFEDNRARNVGDLLTVVLVESTQAKKSAATNTSKNQDTSLGDISVFGKKINYGVGFSGDRSFAGKGDTSQSNSLSGSVTVTVVQRYPNGNLLVRGEKLLELNQGSEVVKLEGIVRSADISTSNSISSDRVGNARVTYAGRGALADSNAQGWLSRFFNSPWMPF
ncbi:flagellar L-ring protein precursor FlgH [Hydrocarboniphaga daqingensis]|uniref:Flagellar L-ring protein n=1 Tax=Hydrocarboniphaga daqingensis TaxID=490188 RepID=A0A1M5K9F0_9GAMM|nr:flagellar basal body L-ring protein FlgH [Hydrocarboniphaga daqingensis]SHG49397.1 flagellar L-ring protein precursor FlgH [Hydrocarboniphaga daqingensis]